MNYFPNYPQPAQTQQVPDYWAQMASMMYPQRTATAYPQMTRAAKQPSMIWVGGFQEADNWPVDPGDVIPLWDRNRPYVYRREADQAGRPSTRTFAISEVTDPPQDDTAAVTRQEFNVLANAVAELVNTLKSTAYTPKYESKEELTNG